MKYISEPVDDGRAVRPPRALRFRDARSGGAVSEADTTGHPTGGPVRQELSAAERRERFEAEVLPYLDRL